MLKNELQNIERLIPLAGYGDLRHFGVELDAHFDGVEHAWRNAAFSDVSKQSLQRYFYYHLEGITQSSDTLFNINPAEFAQWQDGLLGLIGHMRIYYFAYFNHDAPAPLAYHRRLTDTLACNLDLLRQAFQCAEISSAFKSCLIEWINEITQVNNSVRYSFRSLAYFESLIGKISKVNMSMPGAEQEFIALLFGSNFNHLSFLEFCQKDISKAIADIPSAELQAAYLLEKKAMILSQPEGKDLVYDLSWPSLKSMLGDWLQERIALAEHVARKVQERECSCLPKKLPLELSVAHLACLIKLFYEECIFGTKNLSVIFKFFAANFQSKRQSAMSPGSLSKQYYSIDPQTAARIREILQRMVARINRDFFQ